LLPGGFVEMTTYCLENLDVPYYKKCQKKMWHL